MNILFILGNGFDINLDMETKYTQFYSYYNSIESPSEIISNLKKNINANTKTWADLELEFGKYTAKIETISDFDLIYADIQKNLSTYLISQEKSFNVDNVDIQKLLDHLSRPEQFLVPRDQNVILNFREKWKNHHWETDVITLNYTKTLERILQEKYKNLKIGTHHSATIILRDIYHIHGFTNNRMIIGVNDISQIGNAEFRKEIDIVEILVKEVCNQAQGHTIEEKCKAKVVNANLICVFGSSIGITDKLWWDLIIKTVANNDCRLLIFDIDKEVSPLSPQLVKRIERERLKSLLDMSDIDSSKKKEVASRVFYGINTGMFKTKKI